MKFEDKERRFRLFKFFGKILILNGIGLASAAGWYNIQYHIDVEGHLKRAADSNTVETAIQELESAINGMKKHNMVSGSTGVLWDDPSTDVKFWHDNIVQSQIELKELSSNSTAFEKSNMLMKLRETLMDGSKITGPSSVQYYPDNKAMFIWFCLLVVNLIIEVFIIFSMEP